MPNRWIVVDKGFVYLSWPPYLVLVAIFAAAALTAVFVFRELSEDRKASLRDLIRNNLLHTLVGAALFLPYLALSQRMVTFPGADDLANILGFVVLFQWTYFSIKLGRLVVLVFLFTANLRMQFPLLIANLATLLISIVVISSVATELFDVKVMPLFATSAVATLVFGIALQDTLGNMFAGLSLQIDKPYEIDDWIELNNAGTIIQGRVHEITWRATVLKSFTDEMITIPNRVAAQSTIANFTVSQKPFTRSKIFRIPFGTDIDLARKAMHEAAQSAEGVVEDPPVLVAITETTESWVAFRVIYSLTEYVNQLSIGDKVQQNVLAALEKIGVMPAAPRLRVMAERES
jgi:small-conductance mechanosensitive channel